MQEVPKSTSTNKSTARKKQAVIEVYELERIMRLLTTRRLRFSVKIRYSLC